MCVQYMSQEETRYPKSGIISNVIGVPHDKQVIIGIG